MNLAQDIMNTDFLAVVSVRLLLFKVRLHLLLRLAVVIEDRVLAILRSFVLAKQHRPKRFNIGDQMLVPHDDLIALPPQEVQPPAPPPPPALKSVA